MRRLLKCFAGVLGTLSAASCKDGSSPDPIVPPALGNYAYTFDAGGLQASGQLVLTFATADSIAGGFLVPNYTVAFTLGRLDIDAYIVADAIRTGGTAVHRLKPDGHGGLTCVEARLVNTFGGTSEGACSTAYSGR
jgi:hypothetical protein